MNNVKETKEFIKSLNLYDEYIVLACSYGPDSMALLDLLLKENYRVVIAHVNHKKRLESDNEKALLEKYCHENNIIFESYEIEEYPKGNFEKNARDIRYKFFRNILKKYNSHYLFTAHHGDDLIETVLMRLVRGASFKGYSGFNKLTRFNEYNLVRPLVYLTKEDIMNYCKDNLINFAIDKTNLSDNYTRNRIRNNVLPELKKEYENVHKKFIKFSEMINEYEAYFDRETINLYHKLYLNDRLDINEFGLLDIVIQKRLINEILLNIYKNSINVIGDKHVQMILNLINYDKQNNYILLPNNLKVAKFYNMLIFNYHEPEQNNYDYVLKNEVKTSTWTIFKTEDNEDTSNNVIRISTHDVRLPLHVRSRKKNDKIAVKNLNGTKKVKDILIDVKLFKDVRDTYPIVTDNDDNILWIPGIKKSKIDKQKEETYDIILKYVEEGKINEKE